MSHRRLNEAPLFGYSSGGGRRILDRLLSAVLVLAILAAIGTLGYTIASPKALDKFTEFYALGLEGNADWYPGEFVLQNGKVSLVRYESSNVSQDREEEYGRVTLGIVNREQREATYEVELKIKGTVVNLWLDGEEKQRIGPVVLSDGGGREFELGFAPREVSGFTSLTASVAKGERELPVAAIDNLAPDDYVRIGVSGSGSAEFAQIESVNASDSKIVLKTGLMHDRAEGDTLVEEQKVEFILYMDGQPYFDSQEPPHLWIDVKEAS
jgi:hypothetical protein